MALPMSRPTRRPESRFYQARKRVPAELQAILGRTEFKRSLRATSHADVKRLHAEVVAEWERLIATARETLAERFEAIPERDIQAIAGDYYRRRLAEEDAAPHFDWERWNSQELVLLDQWSTEPEFPHSPDFEARPGDLYAAEEMLRALGRSPDANSVERMAAALHWTKILLARIMQRRALGDWKPDKAAEKFPSLPTKPLPVLVAVECPFSVLLAGWARDNGKDMNAKPMDRSVWERKRTLGALESHLGHSDAARVTKADAVAYKAALQDKGLKPASVRNTLSELSAVYRWAVSNGRLEVNPFGGILPKQPRRRPKQRPYTTEEAQCVLAAARMETRPVLRWSPWIMAALGCRLNELMQASVADIVELDGIRLLRIHSNDDDERGEGEAVRSTKNEASVRAVPLHPRLIEEGFLDYVAKLPKGGALFPDVRPDKMFGRRGATAGKVIGRWLRDKVGITDRRVSPNHSWRHYWIDRAREAGMDPETRDALSGHVAVGRNESANYGLGLRAMPKVLAKAIALIEMPEVPDTVTQKPDTEPTQ